MKKLFIILSFFVSIVSYSQKVNPKDFYGITYSALTFGSTTSWDYQTGSHKTLTLTGNSTLSITNAYNGASGVLIVTQDGTGGRTLAVPNGTVVLNSGASESTTIAFSYDGSTFHWAGGKNKRALDTLYQDGDTLRYTINGTAYAIYNKATGGAIANGNYGNVQLNRNSALSGSDSLTVDSSTFKTKNTFQQGNNINNIKILTREIPATSSATSYANTGGTGDRTASITVTQSGTNIIVPNGNNLNVLVNGNTTESLIWFSGNPSGTWFQFDFGLGNQYIIDEIKFYQSTTNSHGTWKVQGSNDGSSFTDIGSSFTLGGFTTQTITALAGNSTAYRYYRFTGVSGSTSSTPYIREFEFKIGTAGGGTADSTHAKIYTNTNGIAIGDTLTKKVTVGDHVFDSLFRVAGSLHVTDKSAFDNIARYKANYGSSYDARTLVDKNYVDSARNKARDSVVAIHKVDSIWRVAGKDTTFFSINGVTYAIKDSTGGISSKTLNVQYTDASNSGSGETDLHTYTLTANMLQGDGDRIEAEYFGTINIPTSSVLKFYFAGHSADFTAVTATQRWIIKATIIRTGTTTARMYVKLVGDYDNVIDILPFDLTSLDFTTTNIIKVTGQDASSNKVKAQMSTITYYHYTP